MKRSGVFVLAITLSGPALAQTGDRAVEKSSGNFMLQHCRAAADNVYPGVTANGAIMTRCLAATEMLLFVGASLADGKFCPPPTVTARRSVQVVVNYMRRHPEVLHLDYRRLAVDALREAWPCL